MMQLLNTDGAWLAIGISVFFLVVGLMMKRVFVKVLKNSENSVVPTDAAPDAAQVTQHD